ncbi:MAG TPA: branched-chain amino acid ABC transporter permease [Candidatus Limnocylindrales bacterium]|nr:branched-chain amino acid ABC transporter permease [Candidatus Limnocylindrales bacterium]
MSGNQPAIEELETLELPQSGGFAGWLQHVTQTAARWPAMYRAALARNRRRTIGLTILALVIVLYPLIFRYVLSGFSRNVIPLPLPDDTIMVFMLIFAALALGLNIVIGFAGLLDLGYVAFYALGAYTAAFLASPHWGALGINFHFATAAPDTIPGIHIPFWIIVFLAAGVAAVFGALLGAPTLRLRGDYLAIVTLGFGEIVPIIFKNLVNVNFELGPIKLDNANLTGGPLGINPIDAPDILGLKFGASGGIAPVYLAMLIVLMCLVIARNLERSRMGRAWMAIREDELAAEMMGVNTVRTKLLAFALGASFAGFAGALQASYQGATTSDFFKFSTSIIVVIMIILGGMGNIWGALAGALVLVYVDKSLLPYISQRTQEIGRALNWEDLASFNVASLNFFIFGLILVVMMRLRPEGFLPSRQRAAELHHAPPTEAIATAALLEPDNVDAVEAEVQADIEAAESAASLEATSDAAQAEDDPSAPGRGDGR